VRDLFDIFPDLPRPFQEQTPRSVALKRLEEARARAARRRAQAASVVRQHLFESRRRREGRERDYACPSCGRKLRWTGNSLRLAPSW